MPAILDATSTGTNGTGSSSLSWSHTLGSGANILIVNVAGETATGNFGNSVVTGVTYNGVAMTKIAEAGNNGGSNATHVSMWVLIGASLPAVGAHTVAVTYTGSTTSQAGGGMSFKGVKPQAAEASNSSGFNGNATPSVNITTITANALLVASYGSQNTPNATSTTGDTRAFSAVPGAGEQSECDGFYRTVVSPGSTSVGLSATNPEAEAMVVASFAIDDAKGAFLYNFV